MGAPRSDTEQSGFVPDDGILQEVLDERADRTKERTGETFAVTIMSLRPAGLDAMSRHAFLLLSSPENPGKIANPLEYAVKLDEAGHDVVVWFDGGSTFWFENLRDRPAPAVDAYEAARERDLIAGVCNHCATHKGVIEDVEAEGFEITGENHQPDVAALAEEGYDLHIV